jgi:hypothetical protein
MRTSHRSRVYGAIVAVASLTLASCGPAETDPGPGGVNAGDAKALDEGAKKLDDRQTNPSNDEPKAD